MNNRTLGLLKKFVRVLPQDAQITEIFGALVATCLSETQIAVHAWNRNNSAGYTQIELDQPTSKARKGVFLVIASYREKEQIKYRALAVTNPYKSRTRIITSAQ